MTVAEVAKIASYIATTAGIVVGGGWAIYRFGLRRERETALGISLTVKTLPYPTGRFIASFNVSLTNRGAVKVGAQPKRQPAYEDASEKLRYAASVLLRQVPADLASASVVRWFPDTGGKSPREGDIELDLLNEYEIDGKTDFWMEPGETVESSASVVLEAGTYLALVTFIGGNTKDDFWRRLDVVQIPQPAPTPSQTPATPVVSLRRGE